MQAARSPLPDSPASPDPSVAPDRYVSRSELDVGGSDYNPYDNGQDNHVYDNGRAEEEQNQEREAEADHQQENIPLSRPNHNGSVSREEVLRLVEAALARDRVNRIPPAPAEENLTFGDRVASESLAQQDVLERLRPFYSQVKSAEYDYGEDVFCL